MLYGMLTDLGLLSVVVLDCSTIISLGRCRHCLIIWRLLNTFRVSFQCHLCETIGSSLDNREWSRKAPSGFTLADGGSSGRCWSNKRRSGGRDVIDDNSCSDHNGSARGEGGCEHDPESLDTRRFGNMRCCIQYDVPPTIMGNSWFSCISSIYKKY